MKSIPSPKTQLIISTLWVIYKKAMLPLPFFVGSFPLWNDLKKNNPGESKKKQSTGWS